MKNKNNGVSDVDCVTNIDNRGMILKVSLSTLKRDIK